MIKKFVSNALLSVVMDKDARKKLQSMRSAGSSAGKSTSDKTDAGNSAPETSDSSRSRARAGDVGSGEDVIETIAQALAEARAEVEKGPRPKTGATQLAGASGTVRATSSPRAPIPSPPKPPSQPAVAQQRPASTPERERLIQEALSIQRQKSHVLEELDPATREKLMVMAQYVMDPSSLPKSVREQAKADARSEGLVDNLGEKAGSLRKKPHPPRT